MRQLKRVPLAKGLEKYLDRKEQQVHNGRGARELWEAARKTRTLRSIEKTLADMLGSRVRCMFCEDSRGTAIDHFWPLGPYPERAFRWLNMLLVCDACNRKKGIQFDLDGANQPLLIDPTADDPWEHLFYESVTGQLTAKYLGTHFDPKGEYTCDPDVLPLNIEAITSGRKRAARNLKRFVTEFLESNKSEAALAKLVDAVCDNNDYDLARWFFKLDGKSESPFDVLRRHYPDAWTTVVNAL